VVVRAEVGAVVPLVPDVPEVLADDEGCELVQPHRATAQQTRTIKRMIALAFIPKDNSLLYLSLAIFGSGNMGAIIFIDK
jgi:hypothetical protein